MAGGIADLGKIPELRKRILFTLGMLVIYRIGVFVPTPGINAERLKALFESAAGTLFGLVNMFTGGALENFSIFALGITPYISVSIIVQLMTTMSKHLEELSKEGDSGRRILTRYTRIGTIGLALIQGYFISVGLESQGVVTQPGISFRIITALTLCAGTSFIMWIGEQITERGIGNGISLLIMAGIVARMPSVLNHTFELTSSGELTPFTVLALLAFAVATVAFVSFCERCYRRIPVQYPRRAIGRRMTQASMQHLPLKLNSSGVMPAIFASTGLFVILLGIQAAGRWLEGSELLGGWLNWVSVQSKWVSANFVPASWPYELLYALLIIFFTYFYTAIIVDPNQIAENLKKNAGFIPTVRPGRDTVDFLNRVLSRITLWGGLYVCVVCIAPTLFYYRMGGGSFAYVFGGTAVLIVVGVLMDTLAQIESHIVARNYEGFMSKSPGKIRGMGRVSAVRGNLIQR